MKFKSYWKSTLDKLKYELQENLKNLFPVTHIA
jgi:hypothetical protein